jgi:hypothetical protein
MTSLPEGAFSEARDVNRGNLASHCGGVSPDLYALSMCACTTAAQLCESFSHHGALLCGE